MKAWAAVEEAALPPSVQPTAFREAVRLLSPQAKLGERGGTAGGGTGGSKGRDGNGEHGGIAVSEDEIYDRVVGHTGVDRDKLEQVVHLDGDTIRVSLPGIKLGKNNADRTRTAAQILAIVRGFGMEEDGTSVEVVRSEVNRLKCYDSANFSSQLSKLNGFITTGSGTNRRIRARGPGIEAFPALVDRLLGES